MKRVWQTAIRAGSTVILIDADDDVVNLSLQGGASALLTIETAQQVVDSLKAAIEASREGLEYR